MFEQVQRGGAAAVEQFDEVGLQLQWVGTPQRVHQRIEFGQPRRRDDALVAQQVAHLRQVAAQLRIGVAEQRRQHAQALRGGSGRFGCEHGQTSARIGIVRFFSPPNRLVSLVPSEQPLPKLKPQPPRTLKAFSAYSRWVVGITKRSS